MANIHFYLLFNGNCEEAFTFYQSVFGKEILMMTRYGDIPVSEGVPPVAERDKQKIENIALPIGKETILMGADVIGALAEKTIFGNHFSIYIEATSQEETDRLFNGLSQSGQITMPMSQAHWGDYFGMLTDKFGINWMINYAPNREK